MDINIQQICSVHAFRKYRFMRLEYRPEIRFLYFFKSKAGYYDIGDIDCTRYTEEQVKSGEFFSNVYIENNIVYENPHVRIRMSNQQFYDKYFKTVEELETFVADLRITLPLIEIN